MQGYRLVIFLDNYLSAFILSLPDPNRTAKTVGKEKGDAERRRAHWSPSATLLSLTPSTGSTQLLLSFPCAVWIGLLWQFTCLSTPGLGASNRYLWATHCAGHWPEKTQTDFVFLEKKIKQVFAITLDECYDKVNKASLESNSSNTHVRIVYLDK